MVQAPGAIFTTLHFHRNLQMFAISQSTCHQKAFFAQCNYNTIGREVLLKGNAQYGWPPCTSQVRSAAFDSPNIISFLTKQATLMRRSTVLSLPPLVSIPCCSLFGPLVSYEENEMLRIRSLFIFQPLSFFSGVCFGCMRKGVCVVSLY